MLRFTAILAATTVICLAGNATAGEHLNSTCLTCQSQSEFDRCGCSSGEESLSDALTSEGCSSCSYCGCAEPVDIKHDRPDSHAPAGVMFDHVHHKGEFMFEYKFMDMYMDGNRFGTTDVSDVQALDVTGIPFMATPTRMWMNMHMIHLMYGLTDNITLLVMPTINEMTMDHLRRNGTRFRTANDGIGDTVLGANMMLHETATTELMCNLACSVPTGQINDTTNAASPMGMTTLLPYPMRVGTGTFNFMPGITFKKYWEKASMGAQFESFLPVGENYRDYSVGEQFSLNWWGAYRPIKPLAFTFRTQAYWATNYNGADPDLNPNMISTANPDMRGGFWFNLGWGAIYRFKRGARLNVEWVLPVAQDLDGVQLKTNYMLFASWSKAF